MLFFAEFSGEAQRHEEELQAIKECRICWLLGSDHSLGGSGWTAAENPSPTLPLIQLPLQEQDPEFYKFLVEEVTQKSSLRTWVDSHDLSSCCMMTIRAFQSLWSCHANTDASAASIKVPGPKAVGLYSWCGRRKWGGLLPDLQRIFPRLWHFLPFHVFRASRSKLWTVLTDIVSCLDRFWHFYKAPWAPGIFWWTQWQTGLAQGDWLGLKFINIRCHFWDTHFETERAVLECSIVFLFTDAWQVPVAL